MTETPVADRRWDAVVARRDAPDDRFVYAVRTTGVYCRPGCASRQPRRENVAFFDRPAAAEQAGFRACLRCRPAGPDDATDRAAAAVARACAVVDAEPAGRHALAALAAAAGLAPLALRRAFVRLTGVSPAAYARARRIEATRHHLRQEDSVSRATFEAGYGSASRLYEQAPAALGMTPGRYRRGGAGAAVTWALASCALGRLLVAATERGVCAVTLGDDDAALEGALRAELPGATLTRDDGALAAQVAAVARIAEGRAPDARLALDVRATAFQRQVWALLQEIPAGSTVSYSELARRAGRPTAARAVARACASNPVALVVPCHRVVREGGALGGYRWGLARKAALLDLERERRPGD